MQLQSKIWQRNTFCQILWLEQLAYIHLTKKQTSGQRRWWNYKMHFLFILFVQWSYTLNQKTLEPWARKPVCCQERYSLTLARFTRSAGYQWSGVRCFAAKYWRIAMLQDRIQFVIFLPISLSKHASSLNQGCVPNIPLCEDKIPIFKDWYLP